jgi:cytochrome c oxidase assembly protein subunit 11
MSDLARRNRRVMLALVAGFAALTALALGSAPLYEIYCRITGFGGTPHLADAARVPALDRVLTISLNGDVAPGLPWRFAPVEPAVKARLGEPVTVLYRATNISDKPTVARAVTSVTSDEIAVYVDEIKCFCFSEQMLKPGESKEFAVTFFIDPGLAKVPGLDDLKGISLSYSLFAATTENAKNLLAHYAANDTGSK